MKSLLVAVAGFLSIAVQSAVAESVQTPSLVLTLAAGDIRLLQVEQPNADLQLTIDDGHDSYVINHPLGHTGPELVLLGPYTTATPVAVTAKVVDGKPLTTLSYTATALVADDPAVPVWRSITEAARQFELRTAESVQKSLSLYAEADVRALPAEWQLYPQYLAAKVEFFLFDLQAAKARLQALPASACTMPDYCYKAALLMQDVIYSQDQYVAVADTLPVLRQQLEQAERHAQYDADRALLLIELGISEALVNRTEQSMQTLEAGLALAKQLESKQLLGEALNGFATWHVQPRQRNLTVVADYLQQALDALSSTTDERAYVAVASNLGTTYSYLGELQLAQKTLLSTLPIIERSQDPSLRRGIYGVLGGVYRQAGDWNPAEHYFRLSFEVDAATGREERQYASLSSLGTLSRQKGDLANAVSMHQQAYQFFKDRQAATGRDDRQSSTGVASTLQEMALDQFQLGNYGEAERLFAEIADQGAFGQSLLASTETLTYRAQLALAAGKVTEALQMASAKWKEVEAQDNRLQDKIQLADLLMQIHQRLGDLVTASGFGESMVQLSNDVKGQVEHIRLGAAWSARMHEGHKRYADLLITRYQQGGEVALLERALAVLESSRGQSLVLQRQLAGSTSAEESPERRNLRRRLTEVSNRRAALVVGSADYESVSGEYFRLLESYQSNFTQHERQVAAADFSLAGARAKLGADKVLVEFLCLPEVTCKAIVVSATVTKVVDAGAWQSVSQLALGLNASLRNPGSDSDEQRRQLGALLFGGFVNDPQLSGKRELLVVPDYPLNNLPLAALLSADERVIDRFAISTIPSLTAYAAEPGRQYPYSLDAAVFADPVFSAGAVQGKTGSSSEFTGWLQGLDRLRWSGMEASNLAKLFAGRSVKVYSRETATRDNLFKEETRNARILHIASHAYYNESMQDLVGIAFSAADPADQSGDFVTLQELFDSSFHAELVVISGCDTGVGEYQPGEGNLSLARGFIAQGANHVISTLWPVSDRASVEFMQRFYSALDGNGGDVSMALRAAQLSLAQSIDYSDPFYWAPYVLTAVK